MSRASTTVGFPSMLWSLQVFRCPALGTCKATRRQQIKILFCVSPVKRSFKFCQHCSAAYGTETHSFACDHLLYIQKHLWTAVPDGEVRTFLLAVLYERGDT